jgi:hypothetical protein
MRRLITTRYTNRPLLWSELDWPLGELADVVSGPQPEPDAARSPNGWLLEDPAALPPDPLTAGSSSGPLSTDVLAGGPLASDYGHGWAT